MSLAVGIGFCTSNDEIIGYEDLSFLSRQKRANHISAFMNIFNEWKPKSYFTKNGVSADSLRLLIFEILHCIIYI